MLSEIFKPFIEASPLSVMMRGLVERLLNPEQVDQWFAQCAQEQYTRELLFSTVVSLMLEGVCGSRKSVNAAYQAMQEAIPVSIQAVYAKLRGVEPRVAAELVRYTARDSQAVIATLAGAAPAVLPGYPVRILDGSHWAATEHRLKELRTYLGGALPGLALVVYNPDQAVVVEVIPCENGHTQERALLAALAATVASGQVWVMDRNFCVLAWLQQFRPQWRCFRHLTVTALVEVLIELAGKVRLARFRKHPRGPQKPRPPHLLYDPKHPHQATAKLLANRRK